MKKIICCFLAIFSMTSLFACQKYKVVDLGTLDRGESIATSINDKGEVCGLYKEKGQSGLAKVFLWSQCTGVICPGLQSNVNSFDSNSKTSLFINNLGQIAGDVLIDASNTSNLYMWDPQYGIKSFSPGYSASGRGCVHDFNDRGEIVYTRDGNVTIFNIDAK